MLPPPNLVTMLLHSLFSGYLGYGLVAVVIPCLSESDPMQSQVQGLQITIISAAKAILRKTRTYCVPITRLLAETGLPSLNRFLVKAVVFENLES